jgi:hypothetical protein
MPDLIDENPDAVAWVKESKAAYSGSNVFGEIRSSVIWSNAKGTDGELLVPLDPLALVENINATDYPLLNGHDPGLPLGKVLRAATFTNSDGTTFVAAVLGLYAGTRISFSDFGFDTAAAVASPSSLPVLADSCWINLATDPREIEPSWLEDVLLDAPMHVEWTELSHNAADAPHELIRLGVLFLTLVWNPYVTAIATEAGKDSYADLHKWIRKLLAQLAERKNPVLEIQSFHGDCRMSFLFRGNDVKRHYAAHDAQPGAAAQAAQLVANLKNRGHEPKLVLYEFHPEELKWYPSFVELEDGKLITDNAILIAVEQLPSGLSLGIMRGREQPRLPRVTGFSNPEP